MVIFVIVSCYNIAPPPVYSDSIAFYTMDKILSKPHPVFISHIGAWWSVHVVGSL